MVTIPSGRRKNRILMAGAVVLALVAGGIATLRNLDEMAAITITVGTGEVVSRVIATGVVESVEQDQITPRVSGLLDQFDLKEGDLVKQDQVIARIDNPALESGLAEALSRVELHRSQLALLERRAQTAVEQAEVRLAAARQKLQLATSQLAEREIASARAITDAGYLVMRRREQLRLTPVNAQVQLDLDQAEALMQNAQEDALRLSRPDHPARVQVGLAALEVREAELNLEVSQVLPQEVTAAKAAVAAAIQAFSRAREDVAAMVIQAPYDALVQQVHSREGAGLTAGAPLVTLVPMAGAKVVANVDERDIVRVAVGQPVQITSPSIPSLQVDGEVTRLLARATKDSSNATVIPVEVVFANPGGLMRQGMGLDVEIEVAHRSQVVRLPVTAIGGQPGDKFVFVSTDGVARRRSLTLGERDTTWVEVIAGLTPGERVITGPSSLVSGLQDGQPIQIQSGRTD